MSKGLTLSQKAGLILAYKSKGAARLTYATGEALERRGYGSYRPGMGYFTINAAGRKFVETGEQLEG